MGRARNFSSDKTEAWPDEAWVPKLIFRPDGPLVWQEVQNGDIYWKKGRNLFKGQQGPQISPMRLFIRRRILSHFK